jgi:hypothetical protein
MRRTLSGLLLTLAVLGSAVLAVPGSPSQAMTTAEPVHDLVVTGAGIGLFPEYDAAVSRYGVTSTGATPGTFTVTATSSDPGRDIRFNGVPDSDGVWTATDLEEGDEVAVFITDAGGLARYSLIYLPAGFPALERVTPDAALDDLAPGHVLLTLGLFTAPSNFYETAVDANGVPAFVRTTVRSTDLQRQPNGSYSVFRPTTAPGRTGSDLVQLDARHQTVRTWRTEGLVNTGFHDAILPPDGTAWLMAYEPNADTGLVDSVIQHVTADGTVLFSWTSAPYAWETMVDPDSDFGTDYAHLNSIEILPDGHLLASFRHLSSVYKIATHADGPHAPGDVIWKLGGRDSDFTFPDGDGGPCAQHTARRLPNGNILMFDNGSWTYNSQMLCVDPADPAGPSVPRTSTRVVEFELDEGNGTATPVRSYSRGSFTLFAGSTQPLVGDATLIGWAAQTDALASEISATGELVWEIRDPSAGSRYFTYRAHKASVPDAIGPEVTITAPGDGVSYVEGTAVTAAFRCTDRGGSSLQSCTGTVDHGQRLDTTTLGVHRYEVTAADGAGGRTMATRTYTVLPAARPDAAIRARGVRDFRGVDVYGSADSQRVRTTIRRPGRRTTVFLRLTNDGAVDDRMSFRLKGASPWFTMGGPCSRVSTSPVLSPGQSWTCRLSVRRLETTQPGRELDVRVPVRSMADPTRRDAVSVQIRAGRP